MVSFLVRRLVLAAPVLFGASLALFALLYVLPGDPAAFVLGDSATPTQLAELRHRLNLDQPVPVQYLLWLARLLRGDLGESLVSGLPVAQLIGQRIPVAVELTLGALIVALLMGVPAGVAVGVRPNSRLARASLRPSTPAFARRSPSKSSITRESYRSMMTPRITARVDVSPRPSRVLKLSKAC